MPRPRRIRLTDRDVLVLSMLGEYSILDRPLLHAMCFERFSEEWCRRNLKRLSDARLIRATTLRVYFDEQSRSGRIPFLFSLTEEGADVVYHHTAIYPRRVLRSEPSAFTFAHRLAVVRVRLAFETAARDAGLACPTFLMEQDVRSDAPKDAMPRQRLVLSHEFRDENGLVITCRPDAAAVLTIPHPTGDPTRATTLAMHLEIDRSTEAVAHCEQKLPGYAALYRERGYRRYWPDLPNAVHRLMWVVPSPERLKTLATAFRNSPVAGYCRLAVAADCRSESILSQAIWRDCDMTPMTLYRPAAASSGERSSSERGHTSTPRE